MPSKNDKSYQEFNDALNTVVQEKTTTDDDIYNVIAKSAVYDKEMSDTTIKQIQDQKTVLA